MKNRKVGILTLPLHYNIGGILQAYALQQVLKKMGYEPGLICLPANLPKYLLFYQAIKVYIAYVFSFMGIHAIVDFLLNTPKARKYFVGKFKFTHPFIKKYISNPLTVTALDTPALHAYDAYIVGSDQVWRPMFTGKIENYFFDFIEQGKKRKFAYAASFGTDNWEFSEQQTEHCKNLLKDFKTVSVREISAVKICEDKFNTTPEHVLDPTMLLSVNDYKNLFKDVNLIEPEGKIFVYLLDPNDVKNAVLSKVEKQTGKTHFTIDIDKKMPKESVKKRIAYPIEKWLYGFYTADFIVTDSFHGCVFSILFNKPFVVIGNEERGLSRFDSILGILGLTNRLVSQESDVTESFFRNDIDWEAVNKILNDWQEKSLSFIEESLN